MQVKSTENKLSLTTGWEFSYKLHNVFPTRFTMEFFQMDVILELSKQVLFLIYNYLITITKQDMVLKLKNLVCTVTKSSIKLANQLISLFLHQKELKMLLYIFSGKSKENPPNFFKTKTSSNLKHNRAAATEFPWWVYSVIREIRGPAKYLFCLVVCQLKYWLGSLTTTLFVCKNAEAKSLQLQLAFCRSRGYTQRYFVKFIYSRIFCYY